MYASHEESKVFEPLIVVMMQPFRPSNQGGSQEHISLITTSLKMILHSWSNSSINVTEVVGSIWYVSLLRLAIFSCMYSARKLIIFHFNSWLSYQWLCRLLWRFTKPEVHRIALSTVVTEPWPQLTYRKFGEIWTRGFWDMRANRQTDKQTDMKARSSQYFAHLPGAK